MPFRVYHFTEFEVFRSSTIPFTAHEQIVGFSVTALFKDKTGIFLKTLLKSIKGNLR